MRLAFASPMLKNVKTMAIIGGGPAGASLATLAARQGCKVAVFHNDKRPPLVVGESLLPAVIPMLRELGIEDEVKAFSIHKPGATVCLNLDEVISASFVFAEGKLPSYAYNTPRDLFDAAVLNAAVKAGATVFSMQAKLDRGGAPGTVRLSQDTLDRTAGFFTQQPDLIVDAGGRNRVISRLLDSPVKEGGRQDVALFAHLDTAFMSDAGHIHLDYLTRGWSWRIPLPGKISLGIVINPKHLEQYGETNEQRFDGYIRDEPSLKMYTQGATRITPVIKYNNYQIIPEKIVGPGWAMIGDAAGFVDPVFSSGLQLGMKGAFELIKALQSSSKSAMRKYQDGRHRELERWKRVIDSWYSGRLFNLYRAGQKYKDGPIGQRMSRRVRKRLARILTGEAVDNPISMKVFEYLIAYGVVMRDPSDLVVV